MINPRWGYGFRLTQLKCIAIMSIYYEVENVEGKSHARAHGQLCRVTMPKGLDLAMTWHQRIFCSPKL